MVANVCSTSVVAMVITHRMKFPLGTYVCTYVVVLVPRCSAEFAGTITVLGQYLNGTITMLRLYSTRH